MMELDQPTIIMMLIKPIVSLYINELKYYDLRI